MVVDEMIGDEMVEDEIVEKRWAESKDGGYVECAKRDLGKTMMKQDAGSPGQRMKEAGESRQVRMLPLSR